MMIEALIFDFDGVICDTEPLHLSAFQQVLAPFSIRVEEDEYYGRYVGLNDRTFLERLGADRGQAFAASELDDMLARKGTGYRDAIARGLPLLPGVRELVESAARRIPLAICSGAHRDEIERLLDGHALTPYFETIVTADDVPRSKPDPAGFRETLRRLNENWPRLAPRHCLVLEDSLLGLQAARASEMPAVAVTYTARAATPAIRAWCAANALSSIESLEGVSLEALGELAR